MKSKRAGWVRAFSLGVLALAASSAMAISEVSATGGGSSLQRVASGTTADGKAWQARSLIVGVNSTGGFSGGGDAMYFAGMPQYSGVASLIMNFGAQGSFICSGTLLPDRQSILTAAHCVTDANLGLPQSTTVYFYGGTDPNTRVHNSPAATAVTVSQYFVHGSYTGEVIDHNDIAVLRLSGLAPAFASSYQLYQGNDLTGLDFNVAGYGARSDTGGTVGANSRTGFLRQGDNRYDYRLGDPDFGSVWGSWLGEPMSQIGFSYLSDFDNGLAANDASCINALDISPTYSGPKFCNLGRGVTEVSTAGGDSGGPQFVNGMIASVTSYGLTFGSFYGDYDNSLNSSFGEFNGFVPVHIHTAFIAAAMVPEPGTYGLMALGVMGVGAAARRRRGQA